MMLLLPAMPTTFSDSISFLASDAACPGSVCSVSITICTGLALMPALSLTHLNEGSVVRAISEKSVPGCLVASAPILIGSPLAFWPLPSPHFDVGPAAFAGVLVSLAPPPLSSLLSPHAATSIARPASKATIAASCRGTVFLLLQGDPYTLRSLRAQRYVDRTLLGTLSDCQGVTPGSSGRLVAASERVLPRIRSAAFSAIISVGALVFPRVIVGITEASTTRSPSKP